MKKWKYFFSNLFYRPFGIRISVRFISGEKRTYYMSDSSINDVAAGAVVRFEFKHPDHGEFAKITLHQGE